MTGGTQMLRGRADCDAAAPGRPGRGEPDRGPVWRSRYGTAWPPPAAMPECPMGSAATRLGPLRPGSVSCGEEFEPRRDAPGPPAAHDLARHLDAAQHRLGLVGLADA